MKAKNPKITTDPKGGVLFVKNSTIEGPGIFEDILRDRQVPFGVVDLEAGQAFPDFARFKAVVVLGGPASANHATPQIEGELAFIKEVLARGIPYLGICLGMQLLVKATGGVVYVHAIREAGVIAPDRLPYTMALTEDGLADPLFEGYAKDFSPAKPGARSVLPIFQLHGETVQLPTAPELDARLLATGLFCTNQAIRIGPKAWGIQGHVELTPALLKTWMHHSPELRDHDRISLLRDLDFIADSYRKAAQLVFGNFLAIAKL